jgi:hypothetical protein
MYRVTPRVRNSLQAVRQSALGPWPVWEGMRHPIYFFSDWTCSLMVERYPPEFKIMVLAKSWCSHLFWIYSGIFRRYVLSGKRRFRRR